MAQIPQALTAKLSELERARLQPTAAEMLDRIVKHQTEAEAVICAAPPGWISHGAGAWREVKRALPVNPRKNLPASGDSARPVRGRRDDTVQAHAARPLAQTWIRQILTTLTSNMHSVPGEPLSYLGAPSASIQAAAFRRPAANDTMCAGMSPSGATSWAAPMFAASRGMP